MNFLCPVLIRVYTSWALGLLAQRSAWFGALALVQLAAHETDGASLAGPQKTQSSCLNSRQ